jgi:hypothetical protein
MFDWCPHVFKCNEIPLANIIYSVYSERQQGLLQLFNFLCVNTHFTAM